MLSYENSGVYKIVNTVNGNYYVGSSKNLKRRWTQHLYLLKAGRHVNIRLQRAFDKYGEFNFEFQIVELCDVKDLPEVENKYLMLTDDSSYNIGKSYGGGDNITNHPELERIRETHSANSKKMWEAKTEEERLLFSQNRTGAKNGNYGNTWSNEARERLSAKKMGINNNPFTGKTLEECHGKERAEEIRQKMSEAAKGKTREKNPFYGKSHTKETLDRIAKTKRDRYSRAVSIQDIVYKSVKIAAAELNLSMDTIIFRIQSESLDYNSYYYLDS